MSQRSTKKKTREKKLFEYWRKMTKTKYIKLLLLFFYKKTKYNKVLNTYAKSVLLELRTGVIKPKIS